MFKKIFFLVFCLGMGRAYADLCCRKFIQPNGVTAYVGADSNNGNGGATTSRTEQKSTAQASAEFFGGSGQRVNLNFQNIEIRSLMQVFSEISGKRFSVNDAVLGSVIIAVENQPWNEALVGVLFPNRLFVARARSGCYICQAGISDEMCSKRAANKGL